MSRPFQGVIDIDIRDSVPDWAPYVQPVAPEGAPNVLYIVLDDVGFSAMEPWGGLIETPIINRLARNGLTYTNWHTTALCSPTRSSLLTGRNHTTNGMACIAEATSGFPNANGHIPFECATIAEVLGERGWNTYMLGKWHLVAADEMNMASTKRNWPVGRGFERYYGFLGGETNQWYPDLVYDNHPVEQPAMPCRSRTASSSTSTTSSAATSRRSSPPGRSQPARCCCRPPSSRRAAACPPPGRSRCSSTTSRSARD
jgi:arylsulfatase A-like enzyme